MPENSANPIQNQIEQRLAELPQDVRDVVLSAQLGEHLRAIGQAHGLHIDQIGVLEDETMLVMLGFFEPAEFSNQIATQLRISSADAEAITQEVNQQVFSPIRGSMIAFAASKRLAKPAQNLSSGSGEPGQASASASLPIVVSPPTNVPITIVSTPTPPPPAPPPMPNAEKMLTETTVAKPIYKTDPYREPIEP